MLDDPDYGPRRILDWVESAPGGRWHLSGWEEWERLDTHGVPYNGLDGFEFRFENKSDAVIFALRWSRHGT